MDQWDNLDLYKALLALAAGIILGLERELKDKSAGLKTISIITLGSALFAIISYKMGAPNNEATRIASYIVSGIGFLGAGVIFKDGVNVAGLTTASVIWLSSAVGMSIGFGEIYVALIFLVTALVLIHTANLLSKYFPGVKLTRYLKLTFHKKHHSHLQQVLDDIELFSIRTEEKKTIKKEDLLYIQIEVLMERKRLKELEKFLMDCPYISEFEL